jgi:hypothetical protein
MGLKLNFKPETPDGFQYIESRMEVAGLFHHKAHAISFAHGRCHKIVFRAEPGNRHDRNAIMIIGCYHGWFFQKERHIGYVPKDVAALIVGSGVLAECVPRLRRIEYDGEYIHVYFDIIAPAEARKKYRLHAKAMAAKAEEERRRQMVCPRCRNVGLPIQRSRGSSGIEAILWLLLPVLPGAGLLYSLWRRGKKSAVCPACLCQGMISLATTEGIELDQGRVCEEDES